MPKIIILRGPLGVGKTTIAKLLAKRIHALVIEYDTVLEQNNLDQISKRAGCIPLKNFLSADKIIIPVVKNAIPQEKNIVLVGCFYHTQHITHLKKAIGTIHIFTLTAPLETCIRRDKNRTRPLGKDAAKAVHTLVKPYGRLIDATQKKDEIIKEIIAKSREGNK